MAQVVLSAPFSLINSKFNDFLFAPVGDEGNGMTLSVISAMSRLDIDPWQEAARLSVLTKEKAIQALAPIIARIPGGRWSLADTPGIAERLVAFLPPHDGVAPSGGADGRAGKRYSPAVLLLLFLVISLAVSLVMALQHPSLPSSHGAPTETAGTGPSPPPRMPDSHE